VVIGLALVAARTPAWAADNGADAERAPAEPSAAESGPGDLGPQISSRRTLTAEERAEKEARKACKIEICDIIATRAPLSDDIACDIKKTWRAGDIAKMLGDQIDWPWGKAVCQSKLSLERNAVAEAMRASRAEIEMPKQTVSCALHEQGAEPYVIEVELSPKVAFEDGKATEATVDWGDVSAPMMIYPLLYAGTGIDNSANVLGPEVVRMVNAFVQKRLPRGEKRASGVARQLGPWDF